MRYEKVEQLLRLCVMMSSRLNGVTLEGIMSEFEVSRRTAERMRDAAIRLLPDVEEWLDADGRKHWRAAKLPAVMAALTTDEIAEVSIASEALRNSGRTASADMLDGLLEKLTAGQGKLTQARWEADLELLMESEGAAFRPGPRIAIGRKLLATLRHAILASRQVKGLYHSRVQGIDRDVVLEPHGILHGIRPFLVAREDGRADLRHYRLHSLKNLILGDKSFTRIENFDIAEYSHALFGTFQEPAFDVAWRFRPSAAADAAEYIFHPDQTTETTEDGALIVRFRAGGALEMAWYLTTWGDAVEVIEPKDFWEKANISRNNLVKTASDL